MFVVVTLSGYGLIGPFQSEDAAINYAKELWGHRVPWFVRPIVQPAIGEHIV